MNKNFNLFFDALVHVCVCGVCSFLHHTYASLRIVWDLMGPPPRHTIRYIAPLYTTRNLSIKSKKKNARNLKDIFFSLLLDIRTGLMLISSLMIMASLAMFTFPKNLKGNRIPAPMKMRAIEEAKKLEKRDEDAKPRLKGKKVFFLQFPTQPFLTYIIDIFPYRFSTNN